MPGNHEPHGDGDHHVNDGEPVDGIDRDIEVGGSERCYGCEADPGLVIKTEISDNNMEGMKYHFDICSRLQMAEQNSLNSSIIHKQLFIHSDYDST